MIKFLVVAGADGGHVHVRGNQRDGGPGLPLRPQGVPRALPAVQERAAKPYPGEC